LSLPALPISWQLNNQSQEGEIPMEITYRIDKEILYIAIEGRIDASNAAAAEEKITTAKLRNC
jgi:hypothetical protein